MGGSEVAYQVLGEGARDLVYSAGVGGHVDLQWDEPLFAAALRRLASFSRLILFDRRGTGASDPVPMDAIPTWEEWTQDLLGVLDAAGSERAAIFGNADAGPVSLLFAATHPERTSALVLGNTSARYLIDGDYPIGASKDSAEDLATYLHESWGTEDLAKAALSSGDADPEYVRLMTRRMRASLTPRAASDLSRYIFFSVDVRNVLPLVRVPTLVLHSAGLAFVPIEHGRYVAAHVPGARFVEVPGADLSLIRERGDDVLDEVEEFLTGVRRVADLDRALATVLFTDIVASTERAVEAGDSRWRRLLDRHDQVAGHHVHQFGGRLVKSTGDGILATFDGPARAIRCAAALREALRPLGMEIRAGVHAGEVERRGDDIGGIAVHIAARVLGEAGPAEIVVSRTIVDLVAGSGLEFRDRGDHELKGVPGAWGLFVVEG